MMTHSEMPNSESIPFKYSLKIITWVNIPEKRKKLINEKNQKHIPNLATEIH